MKTLELNQMEYIDAGSVDCATGMGAAVGITAGLLIATVATGGASLFLAAYILGGTASVSAGTINCTGLF